MSSKDNSNRNIIVLVGAGASVSIDIPAMKGMVAKYKDQIEEDSLEAEGLRILKKADVDSDLEETLFEIDKIQDMPGSGAFRALVEELDSGGKLQAVEAEAITKIQKATHALRKNILEWMADTCLQFDRDKAENNWGELVEILNRENIPLFTTNLDFAIEEIAERHGIDVITNFKPGRLNRKFWDHTLKSFEKEGLLIVKLHGSVDWYATEDRTEIEKLGEGAVRNREGIEIERVAIFPTRFKDIYETYFFSLYIKFLEKLDNASTVIVIGHSLRDEYIRAAIRECFRNKDFKLVYIGPSMPKELGNLKVVSKDPAIQITHIEKKFEDFASTLAYIIRNYPKNEVGRVLREITDFGKKSKITFYKRITKVTAGEEISGDIKVIAPAIPPAVLGARLEPQGETLSGDIDIEVLDSEVGELALIEGLEELELKISFKIPDEIEDGVYILRFTVQNEEGSSIAEKEYVCKVGEVGDPEEDLMLAAQAESLDTPEETTISQGDHTNDPDKEGEEA